MSHWKIVFPTANAILECLASKSENFSKLLFSKKYNEEHFINIILSIRKIFECENDYYTSLLNIDWREIQDGYK